ncbi:hypothetical protein [Burkholderia pseudomallei]|nr:hypothetical protein [Burkholderia pseudomallei]
MKEDEFKQLREQIADSASWVERGLPSDQDALLLAEFAKVALANVSEKELRKALKVIKRPNMADRASTRAGECAKSAAKHFRISILSHPSLRRVDRSTNERIFHQGPPSPAMRREAIESAYWEYYRVLDSVPDGRKRESVAEAGPSREEERETYRARRDGMPARYPDHDGTVDLTKLEMTVIPALAREGCPVSSADVSLFVPSR